VRRIIVNILNKEQRILHTKQSYGADIISFAEAMPFIDRQGTQSVYKTPWFLVR
jgi:hypothetical protein